jgi:hypothetical protein
MIWSREAATVSFCGLTPAATCDRRFAADARNFKRRKGELNFDKPLLALRASETGEGLLKPTSLLTSILFGLGPFHNQ